jgi:hypothetical protein
MAKLSKLLGGDPTEFSPAQAGAAFAGEVSRLVKEDGVDITKAWSKAKLMHPETHARMCESANPTTAVANSGPAQTVPFGSKAFLLPKFWLPPNTSDDIFAAAYAANGYQAVSVSAQKVFPAVVAATAKKYGFTVAQARAQVLEAYPQLSRMAGESTATTVVSPDGN